MKEKQEGFWLDQEPETYDDANFESLIAQQARQQETLDDPWATKESV